MGYRIQAGSINVSRAVYALNWFNIAPGLKYISSDLNLQLVQLGIITTAFYIGLSTFQMVGGLLASRIGNRNTSVIGISILGAAVIATGFSYNLPELFASRLFAGIGSALFFSPALGLIADIVPQESYSFYVGLFNGSFNLGGGVGVLGWNFLDQAFGWRMPLVMAGAIMLFLAAENMVVLRNYQTNPAYRTNIFKRAREVISNPQIWILPIIGIAAILTETVIGQFFVYYAETQLNYSENLASTLGTVYLLIGFVGGALGGYLFGISRKKITLFLASTVLLALLTIVIPFSVSYVFLLLLMIAMGLLTVNSFSMLYTIIVAKSSDRGMLSFSLSFVNFLQIVIGAFSPAAFTIIAFYRGYAESWFILGIVGLLCTVLVYTLRADLKTEFKSSRIKS